MATLKLKIVVVPTYDVASIGVADASTYPTDPPVVTDPILLATPPGFPTISLPFNVGSYNILTSETLGITPEGIINPLPDGLYTFGYSVAPSSVNFTGIAIMRVDRLQEKFDNAFMTLDMMECDQAIKKQAKENLNTIYLLIQGSIAAANNCAFVQATELYNTASNMLDNMMKKNCGCTGNNYMT